MSSRNRENALHAIRENIELARAFVAGMEMEAFVSDRRSIYAVTRCLEIISEASRRLGPDIEARHPHIPWREIASAGNLYRHDYDNVSPAIVWVTVQDALQPLEIAVIAEIIAAERE